MKLTLDKINLLPADVQKEFLEAGVLAKEKLIDVPNMYSGVTASLPWFAVAVYDMIKGAEVTEDYDLMQNGLSWFSKHFPNEYMTLLD